MWTRLKAKHVMPQPVRNGVAAAKAVGMKCIGYNNPDSGNQDLFAMDKVVDSFDAVTADKLEKLFG
jgi:beta-phosphoglucomutase-like phosphatase (HAD superfamily)